MGNLGFIVATITSIIFWAIFLLMSFRILQEGGLFSSIEISHPPAGRAGKFSKFSAFFTFVTKPEFKVFIFGLAVRFFMWTVAYIALMQNSDESISIVNLFDQLVRSDSRHYLNIATVGYGWEENEQNLLLVFFPLYPYIVRLFSLVIPNVQTAAFLVSFLAFSFGLPLLYRLVKLDFGDSVAWWTVAFISFAPPAFFFGIPMTESLMLLTSVACLYFIRTHKWLLVGITGALTILTRMVGITLLVVALVEIITHYKIFDLIRNKNWKNFSEILLKKVSLVFTMLIGAGIYLAINWYISGNPLQFLDYQRNHWSQQAQYFGTTISAQFTHLYNFNDNFALVTFVGNLAAFFIALWAIFYATTVKIPKNSEKLEEKAETAEVAEPQKIPAMYIAYALGYTFVSFSPTWLLSGIRYMLVAVPIFIFLGIFADRKPIAGIIMFVVSASGLIWLLNRFMLGWSIW
ncbi:MAG: glycosyltransferase family 39 protein [Firmicutes bacterium]|nr:glycosyltransferase family 39 protein [Bacillota bacterium]